MKSDVRTPQPLVSVVLCTYDRAPLLPRSIGSVKVQSYDRWQLIVVDDGSTDSTPEVLEEFQRHDARIVVVSQKNRGLALARNAGIRRSSGEFICFIDSDDEYTIDHIAWRVRWMKRHPAVDLIYGGLRVKGPRSRQFVVDLENPHRKLHVSRCYVGGTFFVRRNVLRAVRGFRKVDFGEDYDLVKRVEQRFNVQKVTKRSYIYYCDTPDRLCDTYTEHLMGTKADVSSL